MKSAVQLRSTPACAGTAATAFWNKSDPYRELHTARSEHQQSARVWLRPAGAAPLRAKSAPHRECPPQEKGPRCVRSLAGRLPRELFLDRRGPAPPGTRQLSAEKDRAQAVERIRPWSSSRSFVAPVAKSETDRSD